MQEVINIHTANSCPGNPGPGGYAAVLELGSGMNVTLRGSNPDTTNNRMEATAAIAALDALDRLPVTEREEITLHSNSKYLTDAFNQGWTGKWERNGFRDSGGKPVQDEDIWKRLIALARKWSVRFVWVQGQARVHHNDLAGQIAREEAQQTAAREDAYQAMAREETRQAAAAPVVPENTQDEGRGLRHLAENAVREEAPGLFEYQDLGERGVMIITPIGYVHKGRTPPVYLLQNRDGYLLTDHGETLAKLRSSHPELGNGEPGDRDLEEKTTEDTCAGLRIDMHEGALTIRVKSQSELAYDALRLASAMFRISALAKDRTIRAETAGQRPMA